ncbi:hypothetical protein SLEP1_g44075 [Rubroshorea leprosula]|uniref:Uncharacterized protein n=1 Tax=Rubroshorea leprosula TaxID=152421 RepID=A0AAV5LF26_9ROSI|nr:hypothetical protein SLEP1_g44075 [Rubroshorea leprosula]
MCSGTKTPEAIAEDVGAMMSRIRLTEDADGILPFHEAWKHGDQMGKLCLVDKVHIFDVPIGLHTNKIGRIIGNSLGKMLEVDDGFRKAIQVELENLWCPDNIDELDVAFSDNSWPLFNEKDKYVEVNSRPNHLLDDSTGQNNPINIEHNGGSCADEGPKEGGKGQVEKGNRLMLDLVTGALVTDALDTLGVDTVLEVLLSQEFGSIRGENRKRGGLGSGKWKRLDRNFENSSSKYRDKHGVRTITCLQDEFSSLWDDIQRNRDCGAEKSLISPQNWFNRCECPAALDVHSDFLSTLVVLFYPYSDCLRQSLGRRAIFMKVNSAFAWLPFATANQVVGRMIPYDVIADDDKLITDTGSKMTPLLRVIDVAAKGTARLDVMIIDENNNLTTQREGKVATRIREGRQPTWI